MESLFPAVHLSILRLWRFPAAAAVAARSHCGAPVAAAAFLTRFSKLISRKRDFWVPRGRKIGERARTRKRKRKKKRERKRKRRRVEEEREEDEEKEEEYDGGKDVEGKEEDEGG